jgi:putative transposase
MGRNKRPKAEPTDDWELLFPLFEWPEQQAYEELRPLVLFGGSVAERAGETGTPERTMYRRVERFEKDGMLSLFATDPASARAKRRGLDPAIRRMIVELKAEHPKLNANEIANIVYVRTGRRLGKHTPARILAEEVIPLKLSRLLEPYHETEDVKDAREAVVALHLDGWSVKAVASYMRVSRTTVYRVLGRWIEEGEAGLEDRTPGRPKGVRKVDLATMDFIRRSQENPELGAFRVRAALEQKRGAEVSVRTVGRVMAVHRDLYGLVKAKRSPSEKADMPFRAKKRHRSGRPTSATCPTRSPAWAMPTSSPSSRTTAAVCLRALFLSSRTPPPSCASSMPRSRGTGRPSVSSPTGVESSRPSSPGPFTGH